MKQIAWVLSLIVNGAVVLVQLGFEMIGLRDAPKTK